ncbi:kinase-like domain-containing protein [Trichoderma compactum]
MVMVGNRRGVVHKVAVLGYFQRNPSFSKCLGQHQTITKPLTSGKVKAAMESSDRSFEDWGSSSPSGSSVAAESQEPLDILSETEQLFESTYVPEYDPRDVIAIVHCPPPLAMKGTRSWEEETASVKSAPSHGLPLPAEDRKASGHASGYESGQGSCDAAVTTQRTTQSALESTCRQSIQRLALRLAKDNVIKFIVNQVGMEEKKHVRTTRKPLILAQTECEIGFRVKVHLCLGKEDSANKGSAPVFQMNVIFDPKTDATMLVNKTKRDEQQFVPVRKRPASPGEVPIRIESSEGAMLGPAPYSISWSGKHILDMTVLPRGYMSLVPQHRKPTTKRKRRALEGLASLSGPPPAKKPKTKETREGPDVSTVIQAKPPIDDVVAVGGPTASSSLGSKFNLIHDLCHPLEALKLHDGVKVANAIEEEDYTLVRKADIAVHRKSLVFKARHSDVAEGFIAVKVWRSHSEIDREDGKGMGLDVVGKYWLTEIKNHLEVSKHRAIASIHGFDARFLALYLEYIDAPSLDARIDGEGNPYCTLGSTDARQVLLDMTDAINFVHRKGIVHNDIKPSNILYSRERGAVLVDFGCATTGSVHGSGTRWYIPPEYGGDGTRGAPGDIFALGVVLLFLLRKIPLPELQSPPLVWDFRLLKRRGREAPEAAQALTQWESIVGEAAKKVMEMVDDEIRPEVLKVISRMVAVTAEERATGDQIVETLKEYDDLGKKYVFTYQDAEI